MAQSDAEKKAKAHEYYMKYRKQGKKKGRKKSSKTKQTSLLGVTSSGLNADGTIEAAAIKDRMKKEMNAALAKAKTDEEKMAIRKEYAKKANEEIAKLKADPKYAKAKAVKAAKSSSKGSSKGSGSAGSSKSSSGKTTTKTATSTSKQEVAKQLTLQINAKMAELEDKLAKMPEEKKAEVRDTIRSQIDILKEMLKKKQ